MSNLRESEFIEFKESLSQLSRAVESLVAMLNKHCKGCVLFGIKDNGSYIGVSVGNKTLRDISEFINSKITPTVIPLITEETKQGKTLIRVEVNGFNKPYSVNGNYLIRSGNENKKIEPNIMRELLFSNTNDVISEIESFEQDLSFNQLKQLYISHGLKINNSTFCKNLGLLTKSGTFNLMSYILSDNNNCSIKVVRFAGNDKTEMISRNEYGYRCLILSLDSALEYINSLNETRVILSGNSVRKEQHLFDKNCLKEAWVNACLHCRWDKLNPPIIYIFKNRIEIISTGGLPIDYSEDDFYKGISNPINKKLQRIFGQLNIAEQTGHGVPEIVKKYTKNAFKISENYITVTLQFPFELQNVVSNMSDLNKSQRKVLETIINDPSITTKKICKIVGLQSTRVSVILKELKQLNKLERKGSRKNGYWKITNDK